MTLQDATTLGQSGPGSDGNDGVVCVPYNSSITGASPSDCSMSHPGLSLGVGVLSLSRRAIFEFYRLSRLGFIYIYIYIYTYQPLR